MSKSEAGTELNTFLRSHPKPQVPQRGQRAPRMSIAPRVFERFSQYIARTSPPAKRDLNEELGDINYDPKGGSSCSVLVVILVVSLLINVVCVAVFLYQALSTNDELIREEQCVLKTLIRDHYVKIYNNDIFKNESLIDKSCDEPMRKARQYVDKKISILRQKELDKTSQSEEVYDEDQDRLNEKIDLTDLVMITQYIDKMVDGPRGCIPSKCEILANQLPDVTSILCEFNYKAKVTDEY